MHLYAVLSDIHANFEALSAVEKDARAQARDPENPHFDELKFICLGDTVDYGPQPNECMAWLANVKPAVVLRGNHDDDVSKPKYVYPGRVDRWLWPMTLWTRCRLDSEHRATIRGYAESASGSNSLGEFALFHSDPGGHDNILDSAAQTRPVFDRLITANYGLCGHTHFQTWFVWDGNVRVIYAQPEGAQESENYKCVNKWHHVEDRVSLLNPGSVGQPRFHLSQPSGDRRAAYMLLYHDRRARGAGVVFQWRRVSYANATTAALLRNLEWPKDKDILKDALTGGATNQEAASRAGDLERMTKEEYEQYVKKLPELRETLAAAIE